MKKKISGEALGEIVDSYLDSIDDVPKTSREELSRFVRWFGKQLAVTQISPSDINDYAETIAAQTGDFSERLLPLQSFLAYLKNQHIIQDDLVRHTKLKKRSTKSVGSTRQRKGDAKNVIQLTVQGDLELRERLKWLQEEIVKNSTAIKKAAADKDVRENAPLEAARQYQGQLEGRIRELQATLAVAEVIKPVRSASGEVKQGNTITLEEESSGSTVTWILVDPREADPLSGKLSVASPVGQAILGRKQGTQVRVSTPSGYLNYSIRKVV